jgi:hypothetical protein
MVFLLPSLFLLIWFNHLLSKLFLSCNCASFLFK